MQNATDRASRCENQFSEAHALAKQHAMRLVLIHAGEYQLVGLSGWIIRIYPGDGRLISEDRVVKAPSMNLDIDWDLLAIVNAAIEQEKK